MRAGGRLVSSDTTVVEFTKFKSIVLPGNPVVYNQYLVFPLGLKLQTNQIGYVTYFTDLGLDPKIVISGRADIPSLRKLMKNAINELRMFNLSYHVTAGIEYSLGGNTALVFGLSLRIILLTLPKTTETIQLTKCRIRCLASGLVLTF